MLFLILKSDSSTLMSDHLIHALPAIYSSLAFLFTDILRHGYVNHKIHVERLLDRKLRAHLIRFFLSWYKEQRMCVRWRNSSSSFPASNGVRQGGVLSAILFIIYIDDLLGKHIN